MPLPASVSTVPVHIKILTPAGSGAQGFVQFNIPYALRDVTGNVIVGPSAYVATLDSGGEATISLPATDDPDVSPQGWSYKVTVKTDVWRDTFAISVPVASPGTLEFADITPTISPSAGSTYLPLTGGTMLGPLILSDGSTAASELYAGEVADVPPQTSALRTWHYGLANRFYAPAKIAAIGSSTTEGVGQTAYDRTFLVRLRNALRTRFPVSGVVGGDNYAPSWGNPTYTWPVTRSSGVTTDSNRGWGLKAVLLSASGHTLTHTFTGTSVQVWYSQYAGGGTFSVEIDGVTVAAAVSTNGATDRNAKWVSAALSAVSHTIVVRYVSGSTVYVHGFANYNGDENAGINIYNGGLSGLQSGGILGDITAWAARLATIQPHLVILQLGVNDYSGSVPSATMKTNLKAVIAAVRANSPTNPSFVLFGSPRVTGGTYAEPFENYEQAWKEIASEDIGGYSGTSGVAYFDLGLRQPSPVVDNTADLYLPDLTHSTDKGAAHIADTLANFLTKS